ncbi:cation:proton antiporter [SAR202 cluster bacterium AD-802-E10_MRT_200m]|nr:cation:proton antiporter [SAR202 cluster bacterium AD-802-E10_MRT_200m]MQF83103.1 cation:proton antiporter [SAR202 cluster bacterium AD-802-E10_MRT_200m]
MELDVHELTHHLIIVIFQLALILIVAKIAGEICIRFLKIPAVLGELTIGILISPYLLGGVSFGSFGPIFENAAHESLNPLSVVPQELYFLGQIAAIILLFHAGLETNLRLFIQYAKPACLVALGGVGIPFLLGDIATVAMGYADNVFDPLALFVGSVMTATSVGITARVLSDLGRLDGPLGATIIGAAVIDDVLGILVLTIVVGMHGSGSLSLSDVAIIAGKSVGFWIILTGVLLATSGIIFRVISGFRLPGSALVLALSMALLGAGLAELFGLAMIIGAYSVGLALSVTPLEKLIEEHLSGVYHALVPIFFVVMGMLVDVTAIGGAIEFGVVITILAVIGKVIGCGVPARLARFSLKDSYRIGLGMLPRGEVALIVAGVGLANGVIGNDQFGVAILMTLVTTILAPILLMNSFKEQKEISRNT